MKTLSLFNFIGYCVIKSIRHPRKNIAYYLCNKCGCRFTASQLQCPKCGCKVDHSPELRQESPVPWYCSVMVIIIGIIAWVLGAALEIPGLGEAGRAMVYIPLGSLFGMSLRP